MAMRPESANRVQGAKGVADQFPFLAGGNHRLAIEEFSCYVSPKWGTVAKMVAKVVTSSTLPVGSCHTVQWRIDRQPEFASQVPDYEMVCQFICKLLGSDDAAAAGKTIIELDAREKEQPIRGMIVDAQSTDNKAKTWTTHTWSNVKQSGEEIAYTRATLDKGETPKSSLSSAASATAPGTSMLGGLGIK